MVNFEEEKQSLSLSPLKLIFVHRYDWIALLDVDEAIIIVNFIVMVIVM